MQLQQWQNTDTKSERALTVQWQTQMTLNYVVKDKQVLSW